MFFEHLLPGGSLLQTSLLYAEQYSFSEVFLTDNSSSSIIQRGFLDVLMHCISTIHVFSYSVVKVLFSDALRHLRIFMEDPVEMVRFELMTPCLQGRCSPN